jgi:TRAP-type C4-dicarboxylate transport system substrate-binding protein
MERLMKRAAIAFAALLVAAPASAQVTIKVGGPTINDTTHNWQKIFQSGMQAKAGGKVKVEIYPASQLGPMPRMIEGTQLGTIEITVMPFDFLAGVDRRYTIFGYPGIFNDVEHGFRALHDPQFKAAYWKIGDAKGLEMIGATCDTTTTYVFRRPVRSLGEFAGKKIRVFASAAEREVMKRLDAAAAPMPLDEVILALNTGAIDGAKGTVTVWTPFKYFDVAKYIIRTDEALICVIKNASKQWMDKLPEDLRRTVREEAIRADNENMPFIVKFVDQSYQTWKAAGGEIIDLAPAEKATLKQKLSTVGDTVVENDAELKATYAAMKDAAARTRK